MNTIGSNGSEQDEKNTIKVPELPATGSRQVMKVIGPIGSTTVPVITVPPKGKGSIAVTQCPEYHYELSTNNISAYVGGDGQPKLEWVLTVPPK